MSVGATAEYSPGASSEGSEVVKGSALADLEAIFDPEVQLATAPLEVFSDLSRYFRDARPGWEWRQIFSVDGEYQPDSRRLRSLDASSAPGGDELRSATAQVLEVMAVLFGADELGVRVADATAPPCPRFHVDRVAVRGVLNLVGGGFEYLLDRDVDRTKLGHGAGGQPDER